MKWIKKLCVFLLSILLFLSLLGGATATSINLAVDHPAKIEIWLSQSGLYTDFVKLVVNQAATATGSASSTNGVSLNDPAVKQIAENVFSPTLLQRYVKIFLNANYSWLEGKTLTPTFTIDLTPSKQAFAEQVGQYVTTHFSSLPVCTPSELVSVEATLASGTSDPLQLPCRPPTISPLAAGQLVTQQLSGSQSLLNTTVITQKTFQPNQSAHSKPYYVQLSSAPKYYRTLKELPYILGGVTILCILGILFMSTTKRRGLRHIGFVLLDVGLILTFTSIAADTAFTILKRHVFNKTSNGPLQQGLTNFVQHLETQINNITLEFGVAFIALALIIFIVLLISRKRSSGLSYATADPETQSKALANSVAPENQTPAKPLVPAQIPKAKRPRLIQ